MTGRPDEIRGEVIAAFVVLKQGHEPRKGCAGELLQTVRRELGPVAVIGELTIVPALPKTRSGKIMRRVLKAVVLRARIRATWRRSRTRARSMKRARPGRSSGESPRAEQRV